MREIYQKFLSIRKGFNFKALRMKMIIQLLILRLTMNHMINGGGLHQNTLEIEMTTAGGLHLVLSLEVRKPIHLVM